MITDTQSLGDPRLVQLRLWLEDDLSLPVDGLAPASADASFRRYFRVHVAGQTLIAMDAPPDREDSAPFVRVAQALAEIGVPVPQIVQSDLARGFLLLSDLGSTHLLATLKAGAEPAAAYAPAAAALLQMQVAGRAAAMELSPYDEPMLRREMGLFPEWFLARHLQTPPDESVRDLLNRVEAMLVESALEQPQVLVHRDYHSRNLMVTGEGGIGVIDFQDAVRGAVTYDLVSLYKDCYVEWPRQQVLVWIESHRQALASAGMPVGDPDRFLRWFDWMGLQRHLKVLGVFARLWYRDGKAGYLADLPLVMKYVLDVTGAYDELAELNRFLRDEVVYRFEQAQRRMGVT
jgi:hypothetical protein